MLAIVTDGKNHRPAVLCDHCRRPVERAGDGDYLWAVRLGPYEPEPEPLRFAHKRCTGPYKKAHPLPPGQRWQAVGLERLTAHLDDALGIARQKERKATTRRRTA